MSNPLARLLKESSTLGEIGLAFAAWHAELPAPAATISCRRGCSACCLQPALISPAEAFNLARLMRERPELARRAAATRQRDRQSAARDPGTSAYRRWTIGRIPCPCLDDDGSCTIHPERPLVCRQHLVLSPAEFCSSPDGFGVAVLPLDRDLHELLTWLCARLMGTTPQSIPLPNALAWAQAHRRWRDRRWPRAEILREVAAIGSGGQ